MREEVLLCSSSLVQQTLASAAWACMPLGWCLGSESAWPRGLTNCVHSMYRSRGQQASWGNHCTNPSTTDYTNTSMPCTVSECYTVTEKGASTHPQEVQECSIGAALERRLQRQRAHTVRLAARVGRAGQRRARGCGVVWRREDGREVSGYDTSSSHNWLLCSTTVCR